MRRRREVAGKSARRVAAADKADRRHARRRRRGDAGRQILDHDALGRIDLTACRRDQEKIGRRLAVGTSLAENRRGSKNRISR